MPWPLDDKPVGPIANALMGAQPQASAITPEEIARLIESAPPWAYNFGLRAHTGEVTPGGPLPESSEWDDGEPTGRRLNGTSTVGLGNADKPASRDAIAKAMQALRSYGGDTVHLVAGPSASRSDTDVGESIIQRARSLAAWPRSQVLQDRAIGTGILGNALTGGSFSGGKRTNQ